MKIPEHPKEEKKRIDRECLTDREEERPEKRNVRNRRGSDRILIHRGRNAIDRKTPRRGKNVIRIGQRESPEALFYFETEVCLLKPYLILRQQVCYLKLDPLCGTLRYRSMNLQGVRGLGRRSRWIWYQQINRARFPMKVRKTGLVAYAFLRDTRKTNKRCRFQNISEKRRRE